jgi:hypothetical protein
MGKHELRDGTYADGDPANPNQAAALNSGQRPFWLQHAHDCRRTYAIGVETEEQALTAWLDPPTGYCRFGQFESAADAVRQLQIHVGPRTPLALVWDERPPEADAAAEEEELLLTKASAN